MSRSSAWRVITSHQQSAPIPLTLAFQKRQQMSNFWSVIQTLWKICPKFELVRLFSWFFVLFKMVWHKFHLILCIVAHQIHHLRFVKNHEKYASKSWKNEVSRISPGSFPVMFWMSLKLPHLPNNDLKLMEYFSEKIVWPGA